MIAFFKGKGLDPDAKAYLKAIGLFGGTVESAVDWYVRALKDAGVWTQNKFIQPMVGGNLTRNAINLKNPAQFQWTFYNAPVVDADGVAWDDVTQYALTGFIPGTHLSTKNAFMAYYSLTASGGAGSGNELSSYGNAANRYSLGIKSFTNVNNLDAHLSDSGVTSNIPRGSSDTSGLYLITRDATHVYVYRNEVLIGTLAYTANATANTIEVAAGAQNRGGGTIAGRTNLKCGLAAMGEPLTPAQALVWSAITNEFMTKMGKNTY